MFVNHLNRRLRHLGGRQNRDAVTHHHHKVAPSGLVVDVAAGEEVLIVIEGRTVANVGPGSHVVHPEEIAYWTDGDDCTFDTWFVTTGELDPVHVADRVESSDGTITVQATVRYRITEPALLVESLAATVDLARPEAFDYWLGRQVLTAARSARRAHATDIEHSLDTLVAPVGLSVIPPLEITVDDSDDVPACPQCGAAGVPGDRFCAVCGTSMLIRSCTQCSAPLRPGSRFCTSCGATADTSATAPDHSDPPPNESGT
jgi:antitoxin (DNA-binding transcriptional repressor) of toxin-antitoxin stability system